MTLERLRGGLIVSVQVSATSVLNGPGTIALLALCAERNRAAGVRIEGLERIAATAATVSVPLVGLVKRVQAPSEVYITPTVADARAVAAAGAGVVAFDATARPRPDGSSVRDIVDTVRAAGALALADCASLDDARAAIAAGTTIVATTLCGHTAQTTGTTLPALELVQALQGLGAFTVCEGGIATPEHARAAFAAGADAICVGTAITNLDVLVARFAAAAGR